jgi:glutamyl-tRNA synthetase
MRLPVDELAARILPILRDAGLLSDDLVGTRRDWLNRVIELVRSRVKRLPQFVEELRPFLQDTVEYDRAAVAKHLDKPDVRSALGELPVALAAIGQFSNANLESAVRGLAETRGIKAAALIHATRVAVTGRAVSPGLFEVLELLGAERVTARIHTALNFPPK